MTAAQPERSSECGLRAAHTPGPWLTEMVPCGMGCCEMFSVHVESHEAKPIAQVNHHNAVWFPQGMTEANAALIAAAPDLLAALEQISSHGEAWSQEIARAAIAKAKGGAS